MKFKTYSQMSRSDIRRHKKSSGKNNKKQMRGINTPLNPVNERSWK